MNEKQMNERPLVIGMLRGKGAPGSIAVANAHAAFMLGARLYFFTPDDVDTEISKIHAQYFQGHHWVREWIDYPDVIENDELSRYRTEVWQSLTSTIPYTTHRLGGKLATFGKMADGGVYPNLIIPGNVIRHFSGFVAELHRFEQAVVKPVRGSQGKGLFSFKKQGSVFKANINGEVVDLDNEGLHAFYLREIRGKSFLLQKYVSSQTAQGLPFDIRLHVRRDAQAHWKTVKIYARIGSGKTVASNLSAGGSIAPISPFLHAQFGRDQGNKLLRKLKRLAADFPPAFQALYPDCMIDALGIDIGIDAQANLWLFEVNSYPGAMFFEIDDALPRMGFAIWLARHRLGVANKVEPQRLPV